MTYKVGTKLVFTKRKIQFIQYSTKRFNTREVLTATKVN